MRILLVRVFVAAFLFVNPVVTTADQVQYIYDDLGRLSQVIDGQGNVATYQYDAVGNLLSITRNTGGVGAPTMGKKRGQATFLRIFVVVRAGAGSIPGPRRWRLPLASLMSRTVAADSRRCGAWNNDQVALRSVVQLISSHQQ